MTAAHRLALIVRPLLGSALVSALAVMLAACGALDRPTRHAASAPSNGRAFDRRWVALGPSEPRAISADGRGAVATGRYGEVVTVDVRGRLQWTKSLAAEGEQTLGPVALGGDLVVVTVDPGRVVAMDRSTGETRWTGAVREAALVAMDDGSAPSCAVLGFDGTLAVLDGRDGSIRWGITLAFGEQAVPVRVDVASHRVVATWADAGGSHVRVLDVDTGKQLWGVDAPDFTAIPATTPHAVVLAENVTDGRRVLAVRVRRLDLTTGVQRWAARLPGAVMPDDLMAADGNGAVGVDLRGTLTALDLDTGATRWQRRTRRPQLVAAPLLVGDAVAMLTYGTGLVVLDRADGSLRPNDTPGAVQTRVTLEAAASGGGRLYLLARRSRGAGEVWMLAGGSLPGRPGLGRRAPEGRPLH